MIWWQYKSYRCDIFNSWSSHTTDHRSSQQDAAIWCKALTVKDRDRQHHTTTTSNVVSNVVTAITTNQRRRRLLVDTLTDQLTGWLTSWSAGRLTEHLVITQSWQKWHSRCGWLVSDTHQTHWPAVPPSATPTRHHSHSLIIIQHITRWHSVYHTAAAVMYDWPSFLV